MAEPLRAHAAAPELAGGRFLIVEARYYDAVGAMLLAGARAAIEAAGRLMRPSPCPARWKFPMAMAITLDAASAAGRPLRRRRRARLRHPRRDLSFRDRRRRIRARADGHVGRARPRARQRHPHRGDLGPGRGARRSRRAATRAATPRAPRSRSPRSSASWARHERRRTALRRAPRRGPGALPDGSRRTRASPTSSPNSKRTGSARRSRATNTIPPNSPSSATSSPACRRDQCAIDRGIDDTLAAGWPLKRVEALMRAILRAGLLRDAVASRRSGARGDHGICRRRRRVLWPRGERHDQCRARCAGAADARRRVSGATRKIDLTKRYINHCDVTFCEIYAFRIVSPSRVAFVHSGRTRT